MFRLLAIEWLKLRSYRAFWVLIALFAVLLFLTNFALSHASLVMNNEKVNLFLQAYSFPTVWDNIGFQVRVLGGLIPVFLIISTTNEFQYRTHRQNVIDGWTRMEFLHAKWLLCLAVAAAVTLYSGALGAAFGFIYDKHPVAYAQHLDRLGYIFLLVLNYTALAMTLSFFLKRGALTAILFLSYSYVLEVIVAKIVNWRTHNSHIGDFFPLEASAGLLPFPASDVVRQATSIADGSSTLALAGATAGWLAAYYLLARWRLQRCDW